MEKEFEVLEAKPEDIGKLLYEVYDVPSGICEYINKALTELKAIKEAKPSEAFGNISRGLETIENDLIALAKLGVNETFDDLLLDISKTTQLIKKDLQALLKAQELEKENESLKADLTIELKNKKNAVEMFKEQMALREEQEKENANLKEVLRIIFEKNVDIYILKTSINVEHYNSEIKLKNHNNTYSYEIWYELTQEEFDLLKEGLK